MAAITELLDKIKTAVYGKDVRQSIHDAIQQCYYDGKAGSIDLEGRQIAADAIEVEKSERKQEIAVERERINQFTSLTEGSTTGDAELQDIRIGTGGKVYTSAGDAVRGQAMKLDSTLTDPEKAAPADVVGELRSDLSEVATIRHNFFNKENATTGTYADGSIGNIIENRKNTDFISGYFDAEFGKIYVVSQTNYNYIETDENGIVLSRGGSATDQTNVVITPSNKNVKRIYVSWNRWVSPRTTLDNYVATYENEGISGFVPYGGAVKVTDKAIEDSNIALKSDITENGEEIYYVGANREYTSFTGLLKTLNGNTNHKTIYVEAGVYDIYAELGGKAYLDSITTDSEWKTVSVWIPDNTKVIGLGDVTFNYLPDASDFSNDNQVSCVSVLNVWGNATIENIKINAQNCRYCIHDEADGMTTDATPRRKAFKNLVLNKKANTYEAQTGYISGQAYASGMVDGFDYYFENCYFYSRHNYCWTCHTGSNNAFASGLRGSNITMNNCVFESPTWAGIRFGSSNMGGSQEYVRVSLNNCFIQNRVILTTESGTGNAVNHYELSLLGCNNVEIRDDYATNGWTNIYTPKVLNPIG